MLVYRCAHCGSELGVVVNAEPAPVCADHPNGVVEVYENGDSQPE